VVPDRQDLPEVEPRQCGRGAASRTDVVFDEEHRVGLVATDDLDAEPPNALDRWKVRRGRAERQ